MKQVFRRLFRAERSGRELRAGGEGGELMELPRCRTRRLGNGAEHKPQERGPL